MKRTLLEKLLAAKRAKQRAALITDLDSGAQTLCVEGAYDGDLALTDNQQAAVAQAVARDQSGILPDSKIFVQVENPPLRLIVVGAVHISQALVPMAQLAGYDVTVIDPRGAFATAERFPGVTLNDDWPDEAMEALAPDRRTAVVTLTHDPKLDDPALLEALKSDCFYIAALGSKKTHAARLARLTEAGADPQSFSRIHGPAGLPIGAQSPAEIGISVMAEMTAALRGAPRPEPPQ